jgi:hypothetical protein
MVAASGHRSACRSFPMMSDLNKEEMST